jgi:uncharacterized membrane protein (DUF4010 family)
MKVLGPRRGINLTGILGGLASSTATTISFSTRSRENPALSARFAFAVILASSVMIPRALLLVLVIYPPLLKVVIIPLVAMLVAGLAVGIYLQWRHTSREQDDDQEVKLSNPLKISTAIKFGLAFALVIIIIELAQDAFGSVGVYVTSAVAGLTDVDAIALSVSRLAGNLQLDPQVAGTAVILAVLANTVSKGAFAYFLGSPELRSTILRANGAAALVGVISILIMSLVI